MSDMNDQYFNKFWNNYVLRSQLSIFFESCEFYVYLCMETSQAEQKFQELWGAIGTSWGVNRTMAQIHALLLFNESPLSTEEIMERLSISRGNANTNIRALIDWSLVYRHIKSGERKEFFTAEKDISKVFRVIVRERRKRELEPMLHILHELKNESSLSGSQQKHFVEMIDNIEQFAGNIDKVLSMIEHSDKSWIQSTISFLLKGKQ